MRKIYFLFVIIFLLLSTSCSPARSTSSPTEILREGNAETDYPAPVEDILPAYPAPSDDTSNSYPAPRAAIPTADTKIEDIAPFRLQKPINAGATEVRGTGPKGVPIILSDVTMADSFLAETTVQDNGEFVFVVSPLEEGHRIGVRIGDLSGTEWEDEPFDSEGFFGDEAMLVPQIAFYYDTYMIR